VTIQSLGDKVFTASVTNIPIQATGTSIGESLLVLKDQIEEIYADLQKRLTYLDSDQKELLQLLTTYIPATSTSRSKWF
jgi:hypothetical protein